MSTFELRKFLEVAGIPWPTPTREVDGSEFVSVDSVEFYPQEEFVQLLEPSPPVRDIPARVEVDEDGEEHVVEWRALTDEEYAEAYALYERAWKRWLSTMGRERIKTGPTIVEARFRTKHGTLAEGRFYEGSPRWQWISVWYR